jgi:hypothetical protein
VVVVRPIGAPRPTNIWWVGAKTKTKIPFGQQIKTIEAVMSQPDGSYPRLNGAQLQNGQHQDKIASLIGALESSGSVLRLCDGAQVKLDLSQWTAEEPITALFDTKVEAIGLVSSPHEFLVSTENALCLVTPLSHAIANTGVRRSQAFQGVRPRRL